MKNMLAHSALTKAVVLALLTLLAALPLAQIGGLVHERGESRNHAAQELAARHAGPQAVTGPVIVVPYTERWTDVQLDDAGKVKQRIERAEQRGHLVFPERSDLRGRLTRLGLKAGKGREKGQIPARSPGFAQAVRRA